MAQVPEAFMGSNQGPHVVPPPLGVGLGGHRLLGELKEFPGQVELSQIAGTVHRHENGVGQPPAPADRPTWAGFCILGMEW